MREDLKMSLNAHLKIVLGALTSLTASVLFIFGGTVYNSTNKAFYGLFGFIFGLLGCWGIILGLALIAIGHDKLQELKKQGERK